MIYTCQFCNKKYKTQRGFTNHVCVFKERYENIDKSNIYQIWCIYKTIYKIGVNKNKSVEKNNLAKSSYYNIFNDFVKWCNEIDIINIYEYITFLKQHNVPIKHWTSDKFYKMFLTTYLKNEPKILAIQRSEEYLNKNGFNLETISQNRIFLLLLSGKISFKYLNEKRYPYMKVLDKGQLKELECYYDI